MATIAVTGIRRPNRRADARTQLARSLLTVTGRVVRYTEGAPSPCCQGEWLAKKPLKPGRLVCSSCGTDPRRTGRRSR
jgi:hypothetical protein